MHRSPQRYSAGTGLVSTLDDCLAFAQMMCGGGARGGVRVLSPASVEAMTTDQITAEQKGGIGVGPGRRVLGALRLDAQAQSVGILLTQRSRTPP